MSADSCISIGALLTPEEPEILNLNLTEIKENFDTIAKLKDTISIKPTFSAQDIFCAPGEPLAAFDGNVN